MFKKKKSNDHHVGVQKEFLNKAAAAQFDQGRDGGLLESETNLHIPPGFTEQML